MCSQIPNSTNSSAHHLCYRAPQETWSWWVVQVGTLALSTIGVPGNVMTVALMQSKAFRNKSYSRFLTLLALFDTAILASKCHKRLVSLWRVDVRTWSRVACKLHGFLEHLCYLMSSWLTLCLSAERLLMLKLPFLKHKICAGRKSWMVVVILFSVLAYSQIFRLFLLDLVEGECSVAKSNRRLYLFLHVYIYQILLQFILPNCLTILCNVCILLKLRSNHRRLRQHLSSGSNQACLPGRRQHDMKTTCMLLVITFLHEVTILPILTLTIVLHLSIHFDITVARRIFSNSVNLKNCLELLSEVTFSLNFYIYVLWGRHLRRHVKRMLCVRRNA